MKFLSVLFTVALLLAANELAVHLRRANALPVRTTTASTLHHIYQIQ
jgi:hypothetical protein